MVESPATYHKRDVSVCSKTVIIQTPGSEVGEGLYQICDPNGRIAGGESFAKRIANSK
jgi:hypothetical protein